MIKNKDFYITFGQIHTHSVEGKTFDKDCVAVIRAENYEDARKLAFEVFGKKWAFAHREKPEMKYCHRGLIFIGRKKLDGKKQ